MSGFISGNFSRQFMGEKAEVSDYVENFVSDKFIFEAGAFFIDNIEIVQD